MLANDFFDASPFIKPRITNSPLPFTAVDVVNCAVGLVFCFFGRAPGLGVHGCGPTYASVDAVLGGVCNFDMTTGHFVAVPGPLARSVRDCIEFFKIQNV